MAILRRDGVIIKRNGQHVQTKVAESVRKESKRKKPLTREQLKAALARLNDNLSGVAA